MEYLVHALFYAMKILEWKFGSFDFAHKRAHHARYAEDSFYVTQRGCGCTSSYVAGTPFLCTCLIRYQHVATCLSRVVCFKSEYKWMELFSNPKYLLFNRITGNRRYFEETTSLKPPCTCMLDLNLLSLLVLLQTVSRVQNHQELCKRRKYIAKTVQKSLQNSIIKNGNGFSLWFQMSN